MVNKYRFLQIYIFFQENGYKWWKMENVHKSVFFVCVYIILGQHAKKNVSIPKIVAFEPLWPFFRRRPQKNT